MTVDRTRLTGIASSAFEHPTDRAALQALRKVPGFDLALRKVFGLIGERSIRYLHLANAVRVDDGQFARLQGVYRECLEVLDMATPQGPPELFVVQTPLVNAGALGVDQPFIVLNSGTLELFDDDELRFILGHELGHIACDHALYKTMLSLMLRASLAYGLIPGAGVAMLGVVAALREWDRKSEFTADRAGLLACQAPETAYRVHMKMAGGGRIRDMDVAAFERQALDYEQGGDLLDGVIKLVNLLQRSHPFSVLRLRALRTWVDAGDYQRILGGDYPRRPDPSSAGAATGPRGEPVRGEPALPEPVLPEPRPDASDPPQEPRVAPLPGFMRDVAQTGESVVNLARQILGVQGPAEPPDGPSSKPPA